MPFGHRCSHYVILLIFLQTLSSFSVSFAEYLPLPVYGIVPQGSVAHFLFYTVFLGKLIHVFFLLGYTPVTPPLLSPLQLKNFLISRLVYLTTWLTSWISQRCLKIKTATYELLIFLPPHSSSSFLRVAPFSINLYKSDTIADFTLRRAIHLQSTSSPADSMY